MIKDIPLKSSHVMCSSQLCACVPAIGSVRHVREFCFWVTYRTSPLFRSDKLRRRPGWLFTSQMLKRRAGSNTLGTWRGNLKTYEYPTCTFVRRVAFILPIYRRQLIPQENRRRNTIRFNFLDLRQKPGWAFRALAAERVIDASA